MMTTVAAVVSFSVLLASVDGFSTPYPHVHSSVVALKASNECLPEETSRRCLLRNILGSGSLVLAAASIPFSPALASNGAADGNLPDLPPEAVRSYLQYRFPLQVSADYYVWELQDKMTNTDDWGEVSQLFSATNSRGGQGQPNKIERDFVNPMRILGLSMPPDTADELREAQYDFERAMSSISKATQGVRRDLPVELDQSLVGKAEAGWEAGRVALNRFFDILNDTTGLNELKSIPPAGPNQNKAYGRSQLKFLDLAKKTKLCQNRGGPTLSQAWGQLMVSGYLQDSCGIPDPSTYFYQ